MIHPFSIEIVYYLYYDYDSIESAINFVLRAFFSLASIERMNGVSHFWMGTWTFVCGRACMHAYECVRVYQSVCVRVCGRFYNSLIEISSHLIHRIDVDEQQLRQQQQQSLRKRTLSIDQKTH